MELNYSVGLEMHALGVVARKKSERLVEAVRVARKGQRQVWKVVNMYLRLPNISKNIGMFWRKCYLVCACRHDPVAIFADSHALTGLFKVKVLQQLHATCKLGVVLQTPAKMLARVLLETGRKLRTVFFVGSTIQAVDALHCR